MIHPSSIIHPSASIGDSTSIWHFCHVMEGAKIGEECVLGQNVFIGRDVIVGNRVKIQNNVSLYTGVICEDEVFIGPSAVFTNVINPRSGVNRKSEFQKTSIKKGATIGANATVICGVEIGQYAFVAAGSVVTRSVKDFELVKGNPARHSGWMSRAGLILTFNGEGHAKCSSSEEIYHLKDGKVALGEG